MSRYKSVRRGDLIKTKDARVARITLRPGEKSAKHYHSSVIENVVCLDGRVEIREDENDSKVIVLNPGQIHELPPGVNHYLVNMSESDVEYLLIQKGNYDFVPVNP